MKRARFHMDLFKVFVDLADTRSFTKTAAMNYVTQSAVSQQLTFLEESLGKKLIDWAASPAMQSLYAKYKINFVPAHPDVKVEASLAEVLKGAKIFPIDDAFAGANRKRIVERWINEVLNPK